MESTTPRHRQQEHLTKGDIVIIPSELVPNDDPKYDRRYLIAWEADVDIYAVCSITSKSHRPHRIALECRDCLHPGALTYDPCYIRPNMIYSLKRDDSWRKVGTVKEYKMLEVSKKIQSLTEQSPTEASKPKAFERPPKQRIR